MVVHVPGRDQGRQITGAEGAFIGKAQLGPAAGMADRVPALMGLHPADRAMPTQQRWEWV